MAKWKERVDKILDAERTKLKEKYHEAEGNYRDTGYDRYYNMMTRAEDELEALETYRNSKLIIAQADSKNRRYRKVVDEYLRSLMAYATDHTGVDRPVEETVRALKHRLEQALLEEGLI